MKPLELLTEPLLAQGGDAVARAPDGRVVFVSGYSEESLTETRERVPNSVFLPKPFSLSELTATVQGQIH